MNRCCFQGINPGGSRIRLISQLADLRFKIRCHDRLGQEVVRCFVEGGGAGEQVAVSDSCVQQSALHETAFWSCDGGRGRGEGSPRGFGRLTGKSRHGFRRGASSRVPRDSVRFEDRGDGRRTDPEPVSALVQGLALASVGVDDG